MCLNNKFNVVSKNVSLISFKSKVVCIPRLYLTGSLLVGMRSFGMHVYHGRKVCGFIKSGQSHQGVIDVSFQPIFFLTANVSLTSQASQ